ncbi:MAG: site-specific DNA-methyltransferase [Atopobiaceae bacterium]|jgi:adenine-specific DNA-methyltransferase|nr:site-specific DNA-methyltransferase [Atopobiaceae bacterium]
MSENVSKERREELLGGIGQIRDFIATSPQDENTRRLLAYLNALEKDMKGKKFGLVFEQHREEIDHVLEGSVSVLTEDESLAIDNGGQWNALIEGDNLASLDALSRALRGKVDLIYIDPPYNTGSRDFVYDDAYVDKNDAFPHSKWLSFMEPRLKVAHALLRRSGVIFVSNDDRENAELKLLMDEVFGPECFVSNISWQRTYSTRNDSKGIVNEVEHILVYSKEPGWQPNKLPRTEKMNSIYKNPDGDSQSWASDNPFAPGAATHQGMVYAIQHPFTGRMLYPTVGRCWTFGQEQMLGYMNGWCEYRLEDIGDAKERAEVCGIPEEDVRDGVKAIVLAKPLEESRERAQEVYDRGPWPRFYFTKGGRGGIRRKTYLDSLEGQPPTNLWLYSDVGHTDEAKKELIRLFGGRAPFDTPKPTRLIRRVLEIGAGKGALVLDFFAGSGTTGQAVTELNAADGGMRRCILCTDNEANICSDITYPRWRTVITGRRGDGSEYSEGLPGSLRYYRVGFVPLDEDDYYGLAEELLRHTKELVELENGVDFDTDPALAIALTDEDLDALFAGGESDSCEVLYLGHDVLLTAGQQAALVERGVEVREVPAYYYRELGE